jgi:hypothetical protein
MMKSIYKTLLLIGAISLLPACSESIAAVENGVEDQIQEDTQNVSGYSGQSLNYMMYQQ